MMWRGRVIRAPHYESLRRLLVFYQMVQHFRMVR
jgi:hypothetical protein